jgi:hypothetical protein
LAYAKRDLVNYARYRFSRASNIFLVHLRRGVYLLLSLFLLQSGIPVVSGMKKGFARLA